MSEALSKIYALQQREINKREQQRLAVQAKADREIQAFIMSPVYQTFMEVQDIKLLGRNNSLRHAVINYDNVIAGKTNGISIASSTADIARWRCEESLETHVMRYFAPDSNQYGPNTDAHGEFFNSFVTFISRVLDPAHVAAALEKTRATPPAAQPAEPAATRRKIQTV